MTIDTSENKRESTFRTKTYKRERNTNPTPIIWLTSRLHHMVPSPSLPLTTKIYRGFVWRNIFTSRRYRPISLEDVSTFFFTFLRRETRRPGFRTVLVQPQRPLTTPTSFLDNGRAEGEGDWGTAACSGNLSNTVRLRSINGKLRTKTSRGRRTP